MLTTQWGVSSMTWEIARTLDRNPVGAFTARHMLDRVDGALPADRLEDAKLIVSELVTNAIQHAEDDGPVRLVARWDGEALRMEVHSAGPFLEPAAAPNGRFRVGGWGLRLVDALADRWDVESGDETVVWAEVDEGPLIGLS